MKKIGNFETNKDIDKKINPYFNSIHFALILAAVESHGTGVKKKRSKGIQKCVSNGCRFETMHNTTYIMDVFSWKAIYRHYLTIHGVEPSIKFCQLITTRYANVMIYPHGAP